MNETSNGKNLVTVISGWLVIKSIINLVLGFSLGNIVTLVVAVALGYLMLTKRPYSNYITAVLVMIVVVANLWNNIKGFQVLYLLEAVVDVVSSYMLVTNKDIKEYFS